MAQEKDFKPKSQKFDRSRQVRLFTNLLILILALISLLTLNIHRASFWTYTVVMCVCVALLCLWQTLYLKRREKNSSSFWQQLLIWLGFLGALYVDMLLLQHGTASATQAGLFALLLLGLTLYINGVTHDIAFVLVGLTIALMIVGTITVKNYLLFVVVPIALMMGLIIFLFIRKKEEK